MCPASPVLEGSRDGTTGTSPSWVLDPEASSRDTAEGTLPPGLGTGWLSPLLPTVSAPAHITGHFSHPRSRVSLALRHRDGRASPFRAPSKQRGFGEEKRER